MKYFNLVLSVIVSILYCVLCYLLNDLYLLFNPYVLIALGITLLLIVFIIIGFFKFKKKLIKTILYILYIVITVIIAIIIYYLLLTKNFIDEFGKTNGEYNYQYLISLKDGYNSIDDLKDKKIGASERNFEKAKEKFDLEIKLCKNITDLKSCLEDEDVAAIYVDDAEQYILEDSDKEFFDDLKVVEEYKEQKKEEPAKKVKDEEPFIVYITGIDNSGRISTIGRSEVNILMTVNPKTKQVLLTSIPRDYYVQLNGTTGRKDKLSHAGIYGVDKSINTIEDLLSININYYVRINFTTVTKLVDAVKGITVYSEQKLNFCNIKEGQNNLNGDCALQFAREKKSYTDGEKQRGINQERVIEGIIKKMSSTKTLLLNYNDILQSLKDNFKTNVESEFIKKLIGQQVNDMTAWNIKFINLDGTDSQNYTYSYGDTLLWVKEPDINTINNVKLAINDIINGKLFSEMSYEFIK